mgnify:CR=1 FL=1
MNKKELIREQLESSLLRLHPLLSVSAPSKGWIRAIRSALGMSTRQLASRLAITQQALSRIEQAEPSGAVTVKTLRRIADSLDCVFVCGFVPRSTLEDTVRRQALRVAAKRLGQASHSMALEAQALGQEENQKILNNMVDEIVKAPPSNLWNEA